MEKNPNRARVNQTRAQVLPRIETEHEPQILGSFPCIVWTVFVWAGSQHVIAYATVHGLIIGWDLRAPKIVWKLENNPKHGKHSLYVLNTKMKWHQITRW